MKCLVTALTITCLFSTTAFGVVVFSDDFDTAGLSAWTVTNPGGGASWGLSGTAGHETGNWTIPSGSGAAADVSSDVFGSAAYDSSLISPVIDLSGFTSATIDYVTNYQALGTPPTSDNFDLDFTTDGGATWSTIFAYADDTPVGGLRTGPGVDESMAVPGAGLDSAFQFRYRYYNPSSTAFDWYAQVDNVAVDAVPEPTTVGLLGLGMLGAFFGLRRR